MSKGIPTELGTENVGTLLRKYAVPAIIAMTASSLYNIVDSIFIGQGVGPYAISGFAITFPFMNLAAAFGSLIGVGASTLSSVLLGQKDYDNAKRVLGNVVVLNLIMGGLFSLISLLFLDNILYFFGASENTLPYAKEYMVIILAGNIVTHMYLGLNALLRSSGHPKQAMAATILTVVLNCILDPLFIFVFDMGISGAALATIISQFVSFCLLYIGCRRGGNISINLRRVKCKSVYFSNIFQGGLPSLVRQGLASVATMCLNHAAGIYGDAAIAAISVVQRIMMFGASAMIGFGQGFQPVCGFNFGARLYDRVRQGFWFCVKSSLGFLTAVSVVLFAFAPTIISWFQSDPAVVEFGAVALRLQCITFPAQSWIIVSNMMAQSIGRTVPATFLAAARQGIFLIPAVLLLPMLFNELGLQMAQAIADGLTLLASIPIQIYVLKTMER